MGVMCLSLYAAKIAASSAYFYVYAFLQVLWNALFVNPFFSNVRWNVKENKQKYFLFRI